MSDLNIPDEAIVAACNAYEAAVLDETPRDSGDLSTHEEIAAMRAAAPLIVAAELERIAKEYWSSSHVHRVCRERAAALRNAVSGAEEDR